MKNIHSFFISTITLFLIALSFAPFSFAQNNDHLASLPTGIDTASFFEQIHLAIDSAQYDRAIRELEVWQRRHICRKKKTPSSMQKACACLVFANWTIEV